VVESDRLFLQSGGLPLAVFAITTVSGASCCAVIGPWGATSSRPAGGRGADATAGVHRVRARGVDRYTLWLLPRPSVVLAFHPQTTLAAGLNGAERPRV